MSEHGDIGSYTSKIVDYIIFQEKFVIMTDSNIKFWRWAILPPMGYMDTVGECFLY